MKKLLFVYNPKSGKGQVRTHLSAILETLATSDYDITIYPTRQPLDACETVQKRAGEFDLIVCSGGDGTLDEVVTGVMNSGLRRPIGYIPAGSTNDYASSLGIPRQMDEAAALIVNGEPFASDVGKLNDDYFVYVAAFGILTDVSYQTKQELKNVLGHAAYVVEGIKRVGTWKSSFLRIESEEFTEEGEYIFGMVTNSDSVGGFKGISGKNVELNDGVFEVMLVRTPQNIMDWQEVLTAIVMQDDTSKKVARFKTSHLVITSAEPVAWTRDGENGGEHTRVELQNIHQAFDIMVAASEEEVPDIE